MISTIQNSNSLRQDDSEDDEDWDEPVTLTLTAVRRTAERKRQEMRRQTLDSEMERNTSVVSLPSLETTRTAALILRSRSETNDKPVTWQPRETEATSVGDAKPASASSVISCQPLPPLTDPLTTLSECLASLQLTSNWDVTYEGVTAYRRLLRHHSDLLLHQLPTVVTGLVIQARSLRTQLSRVAIVTMGEMFYYLTTNMDAHVDVTSRVLLERCGEARGFLREDAHVALTLMTSHTSINRCLLALLGFGVNNKNVNIRNTTSSLVAAIVERSEPEKLLSGSREVTERVLADSATFLLDGQAITRHNAQRIFYVLMWHHNFDKLMVRHLPSDVLRNVRKKLDKLRANGVGTPPSESVSSSAKLGLSGSLSSSLTCSHTCDTIALPRINTHHTNDVIIKAATSSPSATRRKEHHWRSAKSLPSLPPYDSDDVITQPSVSSAPGTQIPRGVARRCAGDLSPRLLVTRHADVENDLSRNKRKMDFVLGDDLDTAESKPADELDSETTDRPSDASDDAESDDGADEEDEETEHNDNERCSQTKHHNSSFNTDNDVGEVDAVAATVEETRDKHVNNSDRGNNEQTRQGQGQHVALVSTGAADKRRQLVEKMRMIRDKLSASDRRQKMAGIQQLDALLTSEQRHLPEHIMLQVLERFIPCVHDGSSKVTVSALRVLSHIAQPLSTLMMSQSIHLTLLVQALTSNLASNSRLILDETFTALDKVTDCMDGGAVVMQHLATSVPHIIKTVTKCEMVKRLAYLVSVLYASKSRLVTLHTLPVLWHLVGVVKVTQVGDEDEETDDKKLTSAARQLAGSLRDALGGEELLRLARVSRTLTLHQLFTLQNLLSSL